MVNDKKISVKKSKLVIELYYAGVMYQKEILTYNEYMELIQAIRKKYK